MCSRTRPPRPAASASFSRRSSRSGARGTRGIHSVPSPGTSGSIIRHSRSSKGGRPAHYSATTIAVPDLTSRRIAERVERFRHEIAELLESSGGDRDQVYWPSARAALRRGRRRLDVRGESRAARRTDPDPATNAAGRRSTRDRARHGRIVVRPDAARITRRPAAFGRRRCTREVA